MVRRACRRAERLHLFEEPRQQGLFVQQGLRLLEEVTLVRRTAALGKEQELVLISVDRVNLDLCRKIGVGVAFLVHRQRRELAVAKVAREVRVVDAAGDCLFVPTAGEHELTLLRLDDRRTGVLAHRQDTACGDACVLQEVERNEPIICTRLWVGEDVGKLLEVTRAKQVCDVAHRGPCEHRDRRGIDTQEFAVRCCERVDAVSAEESILGRVGTEWQEFGVYEWCWLGGGHDVSQPLALRRAPAFP